jgi:hypothetical protein
MLTSSPQADILKGHNFHGEGLHVPPEYPISHIYNVQVHQSNIQGPGGVGRCPRVSQIIKGPNDLHEEPNILHIVHNVLGIIMKTSCKGPCQECIMIKQDYKIQQSFKSYKVGHYLIQKPHKQFTLGIFFKLHTSLGLYAIFQVYIWEDHHKTLLCVLVPR